jgi:starch synthase
VTETDGRLWVERPETPLTDPEGRAVTVVHLAAEYVPFARTGGLAEAANGLARFSTFAGATSAVIIPLHRSAREMAGDLEEVGDQFEVRFGPHLHSARLFRMRKPHERAHVFFIGHDGFFDRKGIYGEGGVDYQDNPERWAFFCLAALAALPRITDGPLVLHAHDWHSALATTYLRTRYAGDPWYERVRTVLSVHNAGYQGHLPATSVADLGLPSELFTWRHLEWFGKLNLLKAGLVFTDAAVTVSPNHARELRTAAGGFGLQEVFAWMGPRFSGIVNGIDQKGWDPSTDPGIAANFNARGLGPKTACKTAIQERFGLEPRSDLPLFGMAARLVTQKGLEIILGRPHLLDLNAQFVFIGSGEPRFEHALRGWAARAPRRIAVDTDFTDALEHQLMAGADLLLMPCQYEPCGLTQMRAQRYGALPLVRRVGGLADTVDQGITGLIFDAFQAEPLVGAALRGLDLFARPGEWQRMMRAAMARDFSWEQSVAKYLQVYRSVIDGTFRAPMAV